MLFKRHFFVCAFQVGQMLGVCGKLEGGLNSFTSF
jgi:hypothetical protein